MNRGKRPHDIEGISLNLSRGDYLPTSPGNKLDTLGEYPWERATTREPTMEYTQLDFANFQTRFLRFVERPDDPDKPIRLETTVASLSQPPKYNALSYCWGQISHTVTAKVDGKDVQLSKNLAEALASSGLDQGDLVWADFICINQSDLYEKAYQVRMMGQIYSSAENVIVWLGKTAPYTHHVSMLSSYLPGARETMLTDLWDPMLYRHTAGVAPDTKARYLGRELFDGALERHENPLRALSGLRELLTRPYWERVWIIQETAKARRITVRCGDLELSFGELLRARHYVEGLPQRTRDILAAIDIFRTQEQRNLGMSHRTTLLQALTISRHSIATDPRDKVYALLGLTVDGNDLVPMPTYAITAETIFENLTAAMIRASTRTDVLLLSHWAPLAYKFSRVPCWAVDWSDLADNIPPWLIQTPQRPPDLRTTAITLDNYKLGTSLRKIGIIQSVSMWREGLLVSPKKDIRNRNIMNRISSDLLERLAPKDPATTEFGGSVLTTALVQMIRDVRKGLASEDYNLERILYALRHLGRLTVQGKPVREWARLYITDAASGKQDKPDMAEKSEKSDKSRSTTDILFLRQITKRQEARQRRDAQDRQKATASTTRTSEYVRPHLTAIRVWERIIHGLGMSPESELCFATTTDDQVILTCRAAESGDTVAEIDQCCLPVVLRKTDDGYRLIGEACLGRQENGSWSMAKEMEAATADQSSEGKRAGPLMVTIDLRSEDSH